jgi:hypothetical protein
VLAGIWFLYRWKWRSIFAHRKLMLILGGSFGLYLVVHRLLTINPDAEIVHVYQSLFDTIARGENPYTCSCIFHRAEFDVVKYGNFNYPPLEIWPYYLLYKLAGHWNSSVLVTALITIQFGVCVVLFWTYRRANPILWLPYCPVFLFFELFTNVATAAIFVAILFLLIQKEQETPKPVFRYLLWLFWGAGLLTKFIVIPLFAVYHWHRLDLRSRRSCLKAAQDILAVLCVMALLTLPYGVKDVFKNTILFNLVLNDRAVVTTFYPNVLSGALSWIGLGKVYPFAAVLALGLSVFFTRWLTLFSGFLLAGMVFVFVSPTPEPQFIPLIAYIALVGRLAAYECERAHRLPPGAFDDKMDEKKNHDRDGGGHCDPQQQLVVIQQGGDEKQK